MKSVDRWAKAREMQDFYNTIYNTNLNKKEFYKNENPLTRKLAKYDVTFGFNKKGKNSKIGSYEFYVEQDSFSVYTLNDTETQNTLRENTMAEISNIFRGKSKSGVYNELDKTDNVKAIRGVEKTNMRYEDINIKEIENNAYSQSVTKNIKVVSVRNGTKTVHDYNVTIKTN